MDTAIEGGKFQRHTGMAGVEEMGKNENEPADQHLTCCVKGFILWVSESVSNVIGKAGAWSHGIWQRGK